MRILMSVTTWEGARVEAGLRASGFQTTVAKDGIEIFECLDLLEGPVVLIETDLPDLRWRVALTQLRKEEPDLSILMINTGKTADNMLTALELGADDILDPRMETEEIVHRILAVASRRKGNAGPVLRKGPLSIDLRDHSVAWAGQEIRFSPSQYQIFELLCLNETSVTSKSELFGQLYGIEETPDSRVLEVFLNGMRKRLSSVGAPTDLIETVRGQGYRLADLSSYDAEGYSYPMEDIDHLLIADKMDEAA